MCVIEREREREIVLVKGFVMLFPRKVCIFEREKVCERERESCETLLQTCVSERERVRERDR